MHRLWGEEQVLEKYCCLDLVIPVKEVPLEEQEVHLEEVHLVLEVHLEVAHRVVVLLEVLHIIL